MFTLVTTNRTETPKDVHVWNTPRRSVVSKRTHVREPLRRCEPHSARCANCFLILSTGLLLPSLENADDEGRQEELQSDAMCHAPESPRCPRDSGGLLVDRGRPRRGRRRDRARARARAIESSWANRLDQRALSCASPSSYRADEPVQPAVAFDRARGGRCPTDQPGS